jgi:hypothetical protein
MKKLVFSILVLVAGLSSCKKDLNTPENQVQSLNSSTLPSKASEYISNYYPAEAVATVIHLDNSAAAYIVILNTTEELAFDSNGNFIGFGESFHDPGTVNQVESNTELAALSDFSTGFPEHSPGKAIPVNFLPMSIGQYINLNFAGYTVKYAQMQTICQVGPIYNVLIEDSKTNRLMLIFSKTEEYLGRIDRSLFQLAPKPVQEIITDQYKSYTIRPSMEVITLSDGRLLYTIFLAPDTGPNIMLIVKEDGTILCQQ